MSHIIIIGAGASGLMAASMLLEKGYTITIVEARDRIGGRIHTLDENFSIPVEAGAEFIHGKQPLTMSLLKQAQGKEVLRKGNHYTLANGELQKGDLIDDQWSAFFEELGKLETDTTLDDFMHVHFSSTEFAELRNGVKRFAEGFDIADTNRVSALALREEWAHTDEEDQHYIQGGYKTIIRYLERKIRKAGGTILTSSPIKEIRWSRGNVKLVVSNEIIEGEKVIVTVPLGVLQKGDIRFTPDIPKHQEAFQQMGFGGVIKFLFEFKEPIWESGTRPLKKASFIFSDAEVPTWWTPLPEPTPLITGWLGGPSAIAANHETQRLFDKAITSLEYIFQRPSSEIQSQLRHWHIADWVTDPFAHGAYTYPTVETKRAVSFLTQPVDDTIYFAGEAFYEGSSGGTVEAALVSGGDVAGKITAR